MLRAVDMGPAAEDVGAADFRAFWGDRAELRRFQVRPSLVLLPACTSVARQPQALPLRIAMQHAASQGAL